MSTKRPAPASELFPLIYGELRRVAGRYLGRERRNHTLQPTALVHEAWLRLQNDRAVKWQGRTHGLALGAQAMRRLLVDHGRHQKRDKRGGGAQPVSLDDLMKFYREEYSGRDYTEREGLTVTSDTTFSMVFDGDPSGKALVIQSVDLGNGSRTVAIRLEDV